MFPPEIAGFSFHGDAAGTDDSLAARFSTQCSEGPALVIGASRPGLLIALARHSIETVVVDPWRSSLRRARTAVTEAGFGDLLTYIADDPRALYVPGGARAALVPALAWRAILAAHDRAELLACVRKTIGPGGLLCLDVERVPDPAEHVAGVMRGPRIDGDWTWQRMNGRGLVTIHWKGPDSDDIELDLTDLPLAEARQELTQAGFAIETACDASTGDAPEDDSERLWIVGRAPTAV